MKDIWVKCIENGERGTAQGMAQHMAKRRDPPIARESLAARIILAARANPRRKRRPKVHGLTFVEICPACLRGECFTHRTTLPQERLLYSTHG